MAKYEIKHSCGHVETVNICGTNVHGERDRKIAWLESIPCRECEGAAKAEQAREDGLPELVGSPKQVSWAIDIRKDALAKIDGFEQGNPWAESRKDDVAAIFGEMRKQIISETSAKWFIDNLQCYDPHGEFIKAAKNMGY